MESKGKIEHGFAVGHVVRYVGPAPEGDLAYLRPFVADPWGHRALGEVLAVRPGPEVTVAVRWQGQHNGFLEHRQTDLEVVSTDTDERIREQICAHLAPQAGVRPAYWDGPYLANLTPMEIHDEVIGAVVAAIRNRADAAFG